MQQHKQLQYNPHQSSHTHKSQFRNSIVRVKTQTNTKQEIKSTFNKVPSYQHLNNNTKQIHILRTSPVIDLSNEISDIKIQFNKLIQRNKMLSKQQIENPEILEEQHIFSESLFKKEIEMIRSKFNLKKDYYRKQIEQLKNQLILWERVTQQNEDRFNDYKDQVQTQLKLIKEELSHYINLGQNQNNAINSEMCIINQDELRNTLAQLEHKNIQLMSQINILKQKQSNYKQQIIKTSHVHELKVNTLLNQLKYLNQEISTSKSVQAPIINILKQLEEFKTQNKILKDKLNIFSNMQNELEADLLEAVLDTSQQDKQQTKYKNMQAQKQQNTILKSIQRQDMFLNNFECKQCQRNKNELSEMIKINQKLRQQSTQRNKQFQYGKSYLSNKVMQLEQFIDLSQAEYDAQKNTNIERLRQFQILKIKYKQLNKINNSLEQKANHLSQRLLQLSPQSEYIKLSKSQCQYSKHSNASLSQYISKCQQFKQKQIFHLRIISQYQLKIDSLTIALDGLQNKLKVQKKVYEQQISLLKQQLRYLQSNQYQNQKKHSQVQFNQVLREQIDQINKLNGIIKDKNQQIYKLNYSVAQIEVELMNLKSNFEVEKLKKISEIKSIEINKEIIITNLKNQLNRLNKSQQSLLSKFKSLVEQCKHKDIFIEKHIQNKQKLGSIQTIRADYQVLNNMQQFRNNLHNELKLIKQLENDKVLLMSTIRRLRDKEIDVHNIL